MRRRERFGVLRSPILVIIYEKQTFLAFYLNSHIYVGMGYSNTFVVKPG